MASNGSAPRETDATGGSLLRCLACRPMPARSSLTRVRRSLLDWYAAGHRDFPWRETRDPYAVLVSEVMLQQTQASRVAERFPAFLARFPTAAIARVRLDRGRPRRVERPRVQPARPRPPAGGGGRRARRLAARRGRPVGAAGNRPVHRARGRLARVRHTRRGGGHQRAALAPAALRRTGRAETPAVACRMPWPRPGRAPRWRAWTHATHGVRRRHLPIA